MLVVITGASGSGKTSVTKALEAAHQGLVQTYFFDSIGVPSHEEMVRQYGSGEGWQRAMTLRWVERLSSVSARSPVLLEGQMRLSFVREAVAASKVATCKVILIDCNDDVRRERLHRRGQPEFASSDMMNWAAFLRREAIEYGARILDTSDLTIDEAAMDISAELTP